MRNTQKMTEYNHNRALETRERVIAAINECASEGKISVTIVCKKAGISRTYFTNHRDVRKILDDAMKITNRALKKRRMSENDKDTLNRVLYAENATLKKQIAELEKQMKYKEMYESKCEEVEKLKKQFNAIKDSNLLNF